MERTDEAYIPFVLRTTVQMMSQRGCDVSRAKVYDIDDGLQGEIDMSMLLTATDSELTSRKMKKAINERLSVSYTNFRTKKDVLVHISTVKGKDEDAVTTKLATSSKTSTKVATETKAVGEPSHDEVVIVFPAPDNALAHQNDETSRPKIVVFSFRELMFNILNHSLQSKFTLLTLKEIEDFLVRNRIESAEKLPQMKTRDPVSRMLGFSRGDVVRVERNFSIPGMLTDHSITYKCVV
jgi:DNA-directed RNA polymerase subunit H (RpoH/RPB5)